MLKSQYVIEFLQYSVQIMYNIIACRKHMTGIQADTDPLRMGGSFPDRL